MRSVIRCPCAWKSTVTTDEPFVRRRFPPALRRDGFAARVAASFCQSRVVGRVVAWLLWCFGHLPRKAPACWNGALRLALLRCLASCLKFQISSHREAQKQLCYMSGSVGGSIARVYSRDKLTWTSGWGQVSCLSVTWKLWVGASAADALNPKPESRNPKQHS